MAMYAQTRTRRFAQHQLTWYQRQLPFSSASLDSGKTPNKPLPNFPTSYGIAPEVEIDPPPRYS
jgi:tRNA A37 N6-isopentenylltransferase MiaA